MKFEEVVNNLRVGGKIRRKKWGPGAYWVKSKEGLICNEKGTSVVVMLTPIVYATDFEIYDDTILTNEEKKYLSFIIEPFKDEVAYISKKRNSSDYTKAHICIFSKGGIIIASLPWFKITEKYEHMAIDKNYTLKELEL